MIQACRDTFTIFHECKIASWEKFREKKTLHFFISGNQSSKCYQNRPKSNQINSMNQSNQINAIKSKSLCCFFFFGLLPFLPRIGLFFLRCLAVVVSGDVPVSGGAALPVRRGPPTATKSGFLSCRPMAIGGPGGCDSYLANGLGCPPSQ